MEEVKRPGKSHKFFAAVSNRVDMEGIHMDTSLPTERFYCSNTVWSAAEVPTAANSTVSIRLTTTTTMQPKNMTVLTVSDEASTVCDDSSKYIIDSWPKGVLISLSIGLGFCLGVAAGVTIPKIFKPKKAKKSSNRNLFVAYSRARENTF